MALPAGNQRSVEIDTVSAATATRAALRNGTPPVTSGRKVSR